MAKIEFSAGIEELRLKYGVNKIKMRSFLNKCPASAHEQGYLDAITVEYGDDLAPDYDVEEPYDEALGCIGEEMIGEDNGETIDGGDDSRSDDESGEDNNPISSVHESSVSTGNDGGTSSEGVQEDDTEKSRVFIGYHPITGKEVYL